MTENERKALRDFLLDANCLEKLKPWADTFNIFEVLKITHTEIRHSNILAWLLNPNENHGLGDSFLREFINSIIKTLDDKKADRIELLLQDYYSFQVLRESNHIDLTLVSREEKTAYIIENKIWAGESKHQLHDYLEKSKKEYPDYKLIFAFLTPDRHEASDSENWHPISYEDDVIPNLEKVIEKVELKEGVKTLIENYIRAVRKDIMKERDSELVEICTEIYNKHKDALKLIFENVDIDQSADSEIICDALKDLSDKGLIEYENNNRWRFFTKGMTEYLPDLATDSSSWGTKWTYYYYLYKANDNKLRIRFEIGSYGVNEETKQKMEKMIQNSRTLGNTVLKNQDWKYKTLFSRTANISEDNYEEDLKKKVEKLVNFALENEAKLLKLLKE